MKNWKKVLSSYVRVFLTAVLTLWIAEGNDIFSLDTAMVKKLVAAGVSAVVLVLVNSLNPKYERYGVGAAKKEDLYTGNKN